MKKQIISSEVLIKEFNLGYKKAMKETENYRKRMYQLGYLDALKDVEDLFELKHFVLSNYDDTMITLELNKLKEKVKDE